jgi:hypothetical protein
MIKRFKVGDLVMIHPEVHGTYLHDAFYSGRYFNKRDCTEPLLVIDVFKIYDLCSKPDGDPVYSGKNLVKILTIDGTFTIEENYVVDCH